MKQAATGWRWYEVRSLASRTTLVFAALVTLIWLALVVSVFFFTLRDGRDKGVAELQAYARQVLAIAEIWPGNDALMAQGLQAVVAIENNPGPKAGAGPEAGFKMQVWRDGRAVLRQKGEPAEPFPDTGKLHEYSIDGQARWAVAAYSGDQRIVVQLTVNAPTRGSFVWPSVTIFLMPLVVSLPLLLVPAWVMTRFGLKPLGHTAQAVLTRVDLGVLTPLPETRYKELSPLIEAVNKLMARLSSQIDRERAFVADVAHEIKTPLAALSANIGTVLSTGDKRRLQAALDDLEPGLNRTTHLVQQLIGIAHLDVEDDPDKVRNFDLAEFVRERISAQFSLADAKSLSLEASLPDCLNVTMNPDQVAAIVDNLVNNAIKYSPNQSDVLVSLRLSEGNADIELEVCDQGPGIPAEIRDKVFERFYRRQTVCESPDGAGLGMAIVKRAVARLGGSVTLSDALNGPGLRVLVTIPAPVVRSEQQHKQSGSNSDA